MPFDAILPSPAALRVANGVCFLADTTCRLATNRAVRSGSSDACRTTRCSDLCETPEVWEQAPSKTPPRAIASSRMRSRPVPTSTYEIPVQPMDIVASPTRAPAQAENQHALGSESNQG